MKDYIVLGVAFGWGKRKGLDVFLELSKKLDERYQIVLVGINEKIKKKLPDNIITIQQTRDQNELAKIYSAADVFVNPTREDNYPTVNMEAIACGIPVVTFDTGGSPEILDSMTGIVVPCEDVKQLKESITFICEKEQFLMKNCLDRSKKFNIYDRCMEYVTLWEKS